MERRHTEAMEEKEKKIRLVKWKRMRNGAKGGKKEIGRKRKKERNRKKEKERGAEVAI